MSELTGKVIIKTMNRANKNKQTNKYKTRSSVVAVV